VLRLSKKNLILFCVVPVLVVILLFSLKDRLAAWGIAVLVRRVMPEAQFSAREVNITWDVLTIRNFSIVEKARGDRNDRREVRGRFAEIRYSLMGLIAGPLSGIRQADIRCDLFVSGPIVLTGLKLTAHKHPSWPYLRVQGVVDSLAYQQKEVKDIAAFFFVDKKQILLHDCQADLLGGQAKMRGSIEMSGRSGSFVLDLKDVQLKDVMALAGGEKSIDAGGIFKGEAVVRWQAGRLEFLRGELDSVSSGWFNVNDPAVLEQELRGVAQNIVVENLKNYYYDIGKVELRNLGQDIRMDVILEGKAGRRILELFWHPREGRKP
jgi:hypothetical protein